MAAENGDVEADDEMLKLLREKMRLPLAEARDHCAPVMIRTTAPTSSMKVPLKNTGNRSPIPAKIDRTFSRQSSFAPRTIRFVRGANDDSRLSPSERRFA